MEYGLSHKLYELQTDFISKAISIIESNKIGIFSSPTGTGKTLSLLCSIYNYLSVPDNNIEHYGLSPENAILMDQLFGSNNKVTTVFYCSRTHSQLNQAINELKKLNKQINSCIIGSRKIYCINDDVNPKGKKRSEEKKKNGCVSSNIELELINERCSEHIKKDKCKFYENTYPIKGMVDIEELISTGKTNNFCPYYFLKDYSKRCEIIFLPYSLLFTKEGRKSVNLDIKNSIIIVDEAHNIYESVIQMNSISIIYEDIRKYLQAFMVYKTKYETRERKLNNCRMVIEILNRMLEFQNEYKINGDDERCISVTEYLIKSHLSDFNMLELENYIRESKIAQKLEGFNTNLHFKLFNILKFLVLLTVSDENGRIFFNSGKIRFTPLNPKIYFEEVLDCRALILAGGTMEPIETLTPIFGERPWNYFSYPNICTNFKAYILSQGPSGRELRINYENRSTDDTINDIVNTISNFSKTVTKGGIICFLPSKHFLKILREHLTKLTKKIMFDDTSTFEEYCREVKKQPVIMFSILGGRLSEGINFQDDLCRLLIVIGVPYPSLSLELKERIKFQGKEYPTLIAMKTVNQALGRALRHKEDFAAMVLLDVRYKSLENKLSPWIRKNTNNFDFLHTLLDVKTFLSDNGCGLPKLDN
ncbi:ATP-dependent DNA helicase chl1 [Astathelohania contejeani]|uniref:ATP-dependent DNA helicase CHL1 n=1 Tax=Astathelohania contejeani TaxID=164912 RepID=A0ABQ7I0H8_9MICR|nr:ATP-dependent DNA helicase chl1 [Thelohania contejeani]